MNTETEYLKSVAEDIAARQNPDTINEPKADHRLILEANRLEKAINSALRTFDNFPQRDTFRNSIIGKLVDIADILFDGHYKVSPDTKVLLDLITAVKQILPAEISPLLRLPKAFLHIQKGYFKTAWEIHESHLKAHGIDSKLIDISAIPFKRFTHGKDKLYWGDFTWIKGYEAKLDDMDLENADCNSKTEALMSLLIGRDFNHDRFFIYCKKHIQERVRTVTTKKHRLQEYELCRKLVQQDTQDGLPLFDRHANSLSPRLLKWIKDEGDALKASDGEEYAGKLSVIWNIETLSLFFKLLWDHKIFKEGTLEVFSEQIAAAFSSKGKGDFKAHSIYGRFYVKDIEVLKTLEELLAKMLEDVRRYLR